MINTTTLTGWLTADPISRCAPGGAQRLCFNLNTKDSHDQPVQVACFIENAALIQRVEPFLMPGRGIVITGEHTQREVTKHDRTLFFASEVRVFGCEVPNRSAVSKPAEDAPV